MKRLLTYLLCLTQILCPLPLLAMETEVAVLSLQRSQRQRVVDSATPNVPREVDSITINKNTAGVFRLALDPSLLRENLTLYLIHQNTSVGLVTYAAGQLDFQAWGGHTYSLEKNPAFACPNLVTRVQGSLTLKSGTFSGSAYFMATNLTTLGDINGADALSFVAEQKLDNGARIRATDVFLEGHDGENRQDASIRTTNNLVLKKFQKFDQRGLLQAKHQIALSELDHYTAHGGARTLALCLFLARAKKLTDNGTLAASLAHIDTDSTTLGTTYRFTGDRLLVNGKDLVETQPGAHVQSTVSASLASENKTIHNGIVDQTPNGPGVPLKEFLDAPITGPITLLELNKRLAPLKKYRTDNTLQAATQPGASGIFLSGANSVSGSGHLKTPTGDIAITGAKVQFMGDTQSGFMEHNNTLLKALKATLGGVTQATNIIAFIEKSLKIPGTFEAKSTKIYFPEPPKPVAATPAPAAVPVATAPAPKPNPTPVAAAPVTVPATSPAQPQKPTSFVVTPTGKVLGEIAVLNADRAVIDGPMDGKGRNVAISGGKEITVSKTVQGANVLLQSVEKTVVLPSGVVRAIPTPAPVQVAAAPAPATPVPSQAQTPQPAPQAAPIQPTAAPQPKQTDGKVVISSENVSIDGTVDGRKSTVQAVNLTTGVTSQVKGTETVALLAENKTLAGKVESPTVVTVGKTLDVKPTATITVEKLLQVKETESAKMDGAVKGGGAGVIVDAPKVEQSGPIDSKATLIKAKDYQQAPTAVNTGTVQVSIQSDKSTLAGVQKAPEVLVDSPICHIAPTGKVLGSEYTQVTSTTDFNNGGIVGDKNGTTTLKVGEKNHVGQVHGNLTLDTPTRYDINAILAGHHPELTANTAGFHLITPHSVLVNKPANLAKPFGVKAPSVRVTQPLKSSSDWAFETTQGDLLLEAAVQGHGVKLWSARGLKTKDVDFSSWADFYATGDYHNMGQVEGTAGSSLKVSAANVYNATTRSILRADQTLVEARDGDVHNWNLIQGRVFADVTAKGDVVNHVTKTYLPKGKRHGPIPQFHQANIIGGTGIDYTAQDGTKRKLGLRVVAGNNIINEAGGISAVGDSYMKADGAGATAVNHRSVGEYYLDYYKKKRHGALKHKKKRTIIYKTKTATPTILSTGGRIITQIPNGGVKYTGCQAVGLEGDFVYGRGPVEYYSLITDQRKKVIKSSGWGLKKSSLDIKEQGAVPTRFLNSGPVEHTSLEEHIYGRGVQVHAPSYTPRAKKGILFEDDVLEYSVRQKTSALMPTFFGSGALSGQPLGKALLNSDPLTANFYNLAHATGSGDRLMAGISGAMDLWSTGSRMAETLNAGGDPTNMLLSRVANVGLGYTRTSLRIEGTRSNPSLFNVGTFTPISETGIDLLGGTQVRASVLFNPQAPYLKLGHGKEEVHTRFKSMGIEVGYNFATETPYASVSGSKSRSDATKYRNALIQVGDGGHVDLSGLRRLELDGGNIVTPTISGHLPEVVVTSYQDRMDSNSSGFSVGGSGFGGPNPTGSASFSRSSAHSRTTNQHSGITATKGFGADFSIDHLRVTDTALDPTLAATARQVDFVPIYDSNRSTSMGITLSNLNLSSPENFADSLGRSALVMGAGFTAAEVARGLGAGDFGASLAGTLGSAAMGHQLNGSNFFGSPSDEANAPGLSSLGSVSYGRNGKVTTFMGLNVNAPQLAREWGEIQDFFAPSPASVPEFAFAPHPYNDVEEQAAELLAAQLTTAMEDEPVVQIWDESAFTQEPQPSQSKTRETQSESSSSRDSHEDITDRPAPKKSEGKSKAQKKDSNRKITSAGSGRSPQRNEESIGTQGDEHIYGDLHEPLTAMREFYQSIFGTPPSPTESTLERRCPELVRSHGEMMALEGADAPLGRRILTTLDFLGAGASCSARTVLGTDFGQRVIQRTGEYFNIPREDAQTLVTLTPVLMEIARQPTRLWNIGTRGRMAVGLRGQRVTAPDETGYNSYVTRTTGVNPRIPANTNYLAPEPLSLTGDWQVVSPQEIMASRGLNPRRPANHNYVPFVTDEQAGIWPTANMSHGLSLHRSEAYESAFLHWTHDPSAPFHVMGHGTSNTIQVYRRKMGDTVTINHRVLERLILGSPDYQRGMPVQLLGCHTDQSDYGLAQNLANRIGAPVQAPTQTLWIRPNGTLYVADHPHEISFITPPREILGQMRTFYPGNSRRGHPTGPSTIQVSRSPDGESMLTVPFFRDSGPGTQLSHPHSLSLGNSGGIPRGPGGNETRTFSQLCRDYIRDIESNSISSTTMDQRLRLKLYLQENMGTMAFAPDAVRKAHRNVLFENPVLKTKLILRWQKETGQKWPKYKETVTNEKGEIVGHKGAWVTPHHIIHSSHMGPNEWWNIHPVTYFDHKKIHRHGKPGEILHGK